MLFASALSVALFTLAANAQTFTDCNPLNTTCPSDPALSTTYNQTFNADSEIDSDIWNTTAGKVGFNNDGAYMMIKESGDSVTAQTSFYIFWGSVEVMMKAASGTGIISTIVLLSDDLDEIDWEIMGGNHTHVETNYYGKGEQKQQNAKYYPLDGPQDDFHNYTVNWNKDKLEWILDGKVVRSLAYEEALGKGKYFPQTPAYFKMGIWAAGDPKQPAGTIAWAGGKTDYSKSPFTMQVKSVKITDGTKNATSYYYGDKTGSFESIKMTREGKSKQAKKVDAPPPKTMAQRWSGYSPVVRIIIIAAPLGVLALLALVGCICCFRQRKLGRRERAIEDAQWEKDHAEMMAFRKRFAPNPSASYRQI